MGIKKDITVHMDDKQRIPLTRILTTEEKELYYSFRVYKEGGRIILEPVRQVPEKGHWIYQNSEALKSVLKGIDDAEQENIHDLGSFTKYANDDD